MPNLNKISSTGALGDVRGSLLDLADFQTENGSAWVLSDGSAVPGTRYASLVGANIPDLRGEFVRGADNGRGVDSGRNKGTAQTDATAKNGMSASSSTSGSTTGGTHEHSSPYGSYTGDVSNTKGAASNNAIGPKLSTTGGGSHTHSLSATTSTSLSGDAETRPRNVAVNYYIRVN